MLNLEEEHVLGGGHQEKLLESHFISVPLFPGQERIGILGVALDID